MIRNQTYNIVNLILSRGIVTSYIGMFWNDIFKSIHNSKSGGSHLMILVKVEFADGMGHRTLAHLRRVNFVDRALFTEYIVERLASLNDSYSVLAVSKITFSYIVNEGLADGNRALLNDLSDKDVQWHRFNNMNLPITMKPEEYGRIISTQIFNDYVTYVVNSTTRVFQINVYSNKNEVTILGPSDLKWTDTVVSEVAFRRDIQKSSIYFMDGEVILRTQILPAKPFSKGKKDSKLVNYFVTMDIETLNSKGNLIPYAICASNGTQNISSFLRGRNQKDLFDSFMKQLLKMMVAMGSLRLIVYAHNFSGFDGIFLMKHLLRYGEVKPLLFNGKIMSITLQLGGGKSILFKDSYLLIPHSLRDLCRIFQVANPKTYFPFKLSDIFYKGALPAISYWNISIVDYENLVNKFSNKVWSFREESIKYCTQDCVALHQVLTQFNRYVFEQFSINAHNLLTTPALAMKIFKAHFMPENTLFQLSGDVLAELGVKIIYIHHCLRERTYCESPKPLT